MKTTTKKSVLARLEKLATKSETNKYPINKSSKAYKFALEAINGAKEIRPCYTSGRGRFCSNQDHTDITKVILTKIGIEFVSTNDSPRGGLAGNLLIITTKIK